MGAPSSSSPFKSRTLVGRATNALYVWFLANAPSQNTLNTSRIANSSETLNCHIDYIVGYFNGMAANEPNTPDITDMGSVGMYDGYMDINDPENRDYGR